MGRLGFAVLVLFSVLAMGSFETVPLLVCAASAGALSVVCTWTAEPLVPRRGAMIVLATGLVLTGWSLLQSVPVPAGIARALSPHSAEIWSRCLNPLGESGPSWHPLSLEPIASRIEALKGLTYVSAFVVALQISRRSAGVDFLERVLMAVGFIVALVAFGHEAVGATKVYGLYVPRTDVTRISPLMNANHLAAYLNIALQIAFAHVIAAERKLRLSVSVTLVIILVAAEVWIGSRGAIGAMVFGFVATAVLSRFVSPTAQNAGKTMVALPVVGVVVGVGLLVAGASESSVRELGDADVSKVGVAWRALRSMAADYPLVGVGRGAFETTFPEYRAEPGFLVFTHPENIVVQWISEWGLPVAVLAMGALAYALRPRETLVRSSRSIGGWSALAVVVLQNLVDFSAESPGVVVALCACAALVVGGRGDRSTAWNRRLAPNKSVAVGALALVVGVGALVVKDRHSELQSRYEMVATRISTSPPAVDEDVLRVAMREHPAAAYFPYAGAIAEAARTPNERVPAWIGRVLERSPVYGPAHLVLARWLRRRSRSQSRLEYRLAQEQGAGLIPTQELMSMVAGYDDAIEIAPNGHAGLALLDALSTGLEATLPATAARIDGEILVRDSASPGAQLRQAKRALGDASADPLDAPWCTREDCIAIARDGADRAIVTDQNHCEPYVVRARVDLAAGDPPGALRALRNAVDRVMDRSRCTRELALLAIDAKSEADATEAIDRMTRGCDPTTDCVAVLVDAAALEERRGSVTRAVVHLRRAVELAPERDDVRESLALAASRAGLHSEARMQYTTLVRRHPSEARYAAALAAEVSSAVP